MRDLTRPFSGAFAKMTREREDAITTTAVDYEGVHACGVS